jgi:hypothetical protein
MQVIADADSMPAEKAGSAPTKKRRTNTQQLFLTLSSIFATLCGENVKVFTNPSTMKLKTVYSAQRAGPYCMITDVVLHWFARSNQIRKEIKHGQL